jgi:SAM-dependent methyltransferase
MGFYHQSFKDFRYDPVNVLEIGVKHGNSIRLWKDYFPKANIYGVDINLARVTGDLHSEDRVFLFEGNAALKETWDEFFEKHPVSFDVIIDDGSHKWLHQWKSFQHLHGRLSKNGIYVVEDLEHWFYVEDRHPFVSRVVNLVQVANKNPVESKGWNGLLNMNYQVTMRRNLVAIQKGD